MATPIFLSGANILVSAFTITVIAVDRWISVSNRNPNDTLSYKSVCCVIALIWMLSFMCKYTKRKQSLACCSPFNIINISLAKQ